MSVLLAIGGLQGAVLREIAREPRIIGADLLRTLDGTTEIYKALTRLEHLGLISWESVNEGEYHGMRHSGRVLKAYTLTTAGYVMLDVVQRARNGNGR